MESAGVPSCSYHPEARAAATCVRCLSTICAVCSSTRPDGTVCAHCVARGLRRAREARATRIALLAAVVIVAAIAAPFVYRAVKAPADAARTPASAARAPADAAGKGAPPVMTGKTLELSTALDKEPCDRQKIIEFCESLLGDGEPRYCLTRSDQFFTRCGDFWRLRWLTYEAHKRLSEWDAAIAEATRLVTQFPDDKDYRTWRGLAYEEKADYQHASADYEQAIAIEPRLASVPFNLAAAYQHLGRPCDGIFPLEQLSFYYPGHDAIVRRRLRELYDDPKCSDRMGTGKATIRFGSGARRVTSRVTINRSTPVELVVDTGASTVALSVPLARQLGLPYAQWPTQRAATAGGIRNVRSGYLDEVTVQGVSARHVECTVIDDLVGAEGLLGLSFLSRFEMHADAGKGVLTLVDKRAAAP